MDPNACMIEMIGLIMEYYRKPTDATGDEQRTWIAEDIAVHADSLSHWLNHGGFIPCPETFMEKVLTSDLYEEECERIVRRYVSKQGSV